MPAPYEAMGIASKGSKSWNLSGACSHLGGSGNTSQGRTTDRDAGLSEDHTAVWWRWDGDVPSD